MSHEQPEEFLIGVPGVGIFRLLCPECGKPGFILGTDKRHIVCGACGKEVAEKDDVLTLTAINPEMRSPTIQ